MNKINMSNEQALTKIMNWCSKMERSKFDVQNKLYTWGVDKSKIDGIIERLEKEGFLSSNRFLEAFIKGKLYYNKWGRVKIKYHLKLKGFPENLIYIQMIFEQLKKKNTSLNVDDDYVKKSKVIQFGASRGYETELALQCVDKFTK